MRKKSQSQKKKKKKTLLFLFPGSFFNSTVGETLSCRLPPFTKGPMVFNNFFLLQGFISSSKMVSVLALDVCFFSRFRSYSGCCSHGAGRGAGTELRIRRRGGANDFSKG